jgi:peptide chain release factor 1
MQDEKSQMKNKTKAMKVLSARIQDLKVREEAAKRASARKVQVGTGDRSERIRTYNFSQGRVTDHRINLTLYNLDNILDGDLDTLTDALTMADQQAALLNGVETAAEAEG